MTTLTPKSWHDHLCKKSGIRIDHYLAEYYAELSRARIQKLIEAEHILVNGKKTKNNYQLKAADKISLFFPAPIPVNLIPENIPLKILYEDEHLLVLDKTAGMVVHPAPGHYQGTLVNALLHHAGNELGFGIGGELRPGIVHRIDRNTSGILVISKNDKTHAGLTEQFKTHTITRKYIGMCWGELAPRGEWIDPIGRDPKNRKRMAVVKTGRNARTSYIKTLCFLGQASLFEAELFTGRTHQIRVHFSSHGNALLGDAIYTSAYRSARQKKERSMHFLQKKFPSLTEKILALYAQERQFLHACHLGFIHPILKKTLTFDSALPEDLNHILEEWKKVL